MSDLRGKKAWDEVARYLGPPLSRPGPAGPVGPGAAHEEHLLLQRNASAVGLLHTTFTRLRLSVQMWSQLENVLRRYKSLLPRP